MARHRAVRHTRIRTGIDTLEEAARAAVRGSRHAHPHLRRQPSRPGPLRRGDHPSGGGPPGRSPPPPSLRRTWALRHLSSDPRNCGRGAPASWGIGAADPADSPRGRPSALGLPVPNKRGRHLSGGLRQDAPPTETRPDSASGRNHQDLWTEVNPAGNPRPARRECGSCRPRRGRDRRPLAWRHPHRPRWPSAPIRPPREGPGGAWRRAPRRSR